MILLDTCALIDLISPKPTLSSFTLEELEKGTMILSISFAEIACKIALQKLEIALPPEALLERVQETEHFHIRDISSRMWFDAIHLHWEHQGRPHKDPADRLILSYAIAQGLPIVTTDQLMEQRYPHCIW